MVTGYTSRSGVASVLAVACLGGCSVVFDFHEGLPSASPCRVDLDCAPGESCVRGACTTTSSASLEGGGADGTATDASRADGASTAADAQTVPDAPAEGAPGSGCGDTDADPMNCGRCDNVCGSGICELGACRDLVTYGWPGQGDTRQSVSGGSLVGIPLNAFSHPGWLTKIGMLLQSPPGIHAYAGIYLDVDGRPATLVAAGANEITTVTDLNEVEIVPPVPVSVGKYWLVVVFDTSATFALSGSPDVGWAIGPYPYAPLPSSAPTAVMPRATDLFAPPNVYAIVAQ